MWITDPKNIKRSKKSTVKIENVISHCYTTQCPHCKTFIQSYNWDRVLRISCTHCQKPIDLIWPDNSFPAIYNKVRKIK